MILTPEVNMSNCKKPPMPDYMIYVSGYCFMAILFVGVVYAATVIIAFEFFIAPSFLRAFLAVSFSVLVFYIMNEKTEKSLPGGWTVFFGIFSTLVYTVLNGVFITIAPHIFQ